MDELNHFVKEARCKYGRRNLCYKCFYKENKKGQIKWRKEQGYKTLRYQNITVWVKAPERIQCAICKRKIGEGIKQLARHHFIYKYSQNKVKENPELALENTIIVCYPCHRLCDALRTLIEVNRWERLDDIIMSMPEELIEEYVTNLRELGITLSDEYNKILRNKDKNGS